MRVRLLACCLLGCWLAPGGVAAQEITIPGDELGAYRDTLDLAQPQPFRLRTFIRPGTEVIYVGRVRVDTSAYRIAYRDGLLWLNDPVLEAGATAVVVYRTWGAGFQEAYRRRRVAVRDSTGSSDSLAVVEERRPGSNGFDPFQGVALQRSGTISRGILAGNNRDVTVESGLRMQLSGEVAEGVRVQAVLTDENTPILPEGTTQRLSEFDRVFIEIQASEGTAQLGDVDLSFQESEFARFTRKLQGVSLIGALPGPDGSFVGGGRVAVAGATARGIFQSKDLAVVDGVQGPYRLEGQNGEQFIIVIPGSETVFVNGQRVDRGERNAYIIDYATGEVTFTSNRLLRKEDRVTVEFQYTTNQFTRTVVGSEADVRFWERSDGASRARLGATFLREADSEQFSEEFGLTAEDDSLLAAVGDGVATQNGAIPVPFDPEAPFVQYTLRDTVLVDGTADSVYAALRRAPSAGETVYRVRFTRVGSGEGRYAREGRTVNGIVYVYRGPGRGDYEPIRILPKPRQQRLLDLRGGFSPVPGVELFGEWARSVNDENRLSAADGEDDQGTAYVGGLRFAPIPLRVRETSLGSFSAELRRRFTGEHFASFDRTRPIEFARQWNLDARRSGRSGSTVQTDDETIDEARVAWAFSGTSRIEGELGRIQVGNSFEGSRQAITATLAEAGRPGLTYLLERIRSRDAAAQESGRWFRQRGRIDVPFLGRQLVPSLDFEQEHRRQRVLGTDSLAASSFGFVEIRPGIRWSRAQFQWGTSLALRDEDEWAEGTVRDANRLWTLQSDVTVRSGRVLTTEGSVGYRSRHFSGYFREVRKERDRESIVLRWNGRFQPLERSVQFNWQYEALTERTPELQEIYIRTGPELGEYVWVDANDDGIIQLDEFVPETTPDEGAYVRTFIPSDSLASIIGVQTQASLMLEPARKWRRARARWKRLAARVATRTTVQIQEKSRDPDLAQIYLLNLRRFRDPDNTLKGLLRVAQDVYLFRDEPAYGLTVSYNQTNTLNELAAGEETRFINQWRVDGTLRPSTRWGLRVQGVLEKNRTTSEQFASRRFDIVSRSVEPEVTVNPSRSVQVSAGVAYARKRDEALDRGASVWRIPLTSRYTLVRRFGVNGRVEAARVALDGDAVGLAQFELTEGRGPGTSFLWALSGWYQFSRLLRATFTYNGRAPAEAPTLHTVRVQLSAIF